MKKSFKITFVILFLGLIPMSCNWNPCGDLPDYKNFNILSFSINTTNLKGLRLDTTVYFNYDSVAKEIQVNKTQEVVSTQNFNFDLFNQTAIACDPAYPSSLNFIKEISIISNSNFEYLYDTINIGDDITNIFLIDNYYSKSIPINVYLTSENRMDYDERLYLKLSEKPHKETEVKFDIKIVLSDNVVQEFKDQVLKVK